MDIIKTNKELKIIWKNKISKSQTKISQKNYTSYRTVFPVELYNYLVCENKTLYINKIREKVYEITQDEKSEKLILKENNSGKTNKSGKRMTLKKSFFTGELLENSEYVKFMLIFHFNVGCEETYMIEFI